MKKLLLAAILILNAVIFSQTFTDINAGLPGAGLSSTVAWGDYDNDGDLDIYLTGTSSGLFRNDSGVFTEVSAGLYFLDPGSFAWGDYDNDGDLDIVSTFHQPYGDKPPPYYLYYSVLYRNDGTNSFTALGVGLYDVEDSVIAWGDYDNDGDLDILLSGSNYTEGKISKIYRNDSGVFTDINAGLTGVGYSSVAWGDYDNDGDLDILLTGRGDTYNYISKIYRNDNSVFTDINAGLIGVYYSSVAWGDYDNDGNLDILLTGSSASGSISRIYRNEGNGVFTDINAGLVGVWGGSVAWGDYDNDGDLDILLSGRSESVSISRIYRNDGNGVFTDINAGLVGISNGSVAWGDYDNDGDLDILLSGYTGTEYISRIYRNDLTTPNTPPFAPSNLNSIADGLNTTLSWDQATDAQTPQNGLSYNVYIGSLSQTVNKKSPMSEIDTGYRKIVCIGNSGQNNSYTIKDLPDGTYYWSVQAIDHSYAGSAFAPEQTIIVTGIDGETVPLVTELYQNYPNPFNPVTTISYALPKATQVELNVYNLNGQLVKSLVNGKMDKGVHKAEFNGADLTTGMYIYKLKVDGIVVQSRKMIMLK